ncbi:hypothetical protein SEVIR_9G576875v4 [Setaria viridis]
MQFLGSLVALEAMASVARHQQSPVARGDVAADARRDLRHERRHAAVEPVAMTHGRRPASPCATYPNVEKPLVTSTSHVLSRYISLSAFTSSAASPHRCSPS